MRRGPSTDAVRGSGFVLGSRTLAALLLGTLTVVAGWVVGPVDASVRAVAVAGSTGDSGTAARVVPGSPRLASAARPASNPVAVGIAAVGIATVGVGQRSAEQLRGVVATLGAGGADASTVVPWVALLAAAVLLVLSGPALRLATGTGRGAAARRDARSVRGPPAARPAHA